MFHNLKVVNRCFELSRRAVILPVDGKRYIRGRGSNAVKRCEKEKEQNILSYPEAQDALQQYLPKRRHGAKTQRNREYYEDVGSTAFSPVAAIREAQLLKETKIHDIKPLLNEPFIPNWKSSPEKDSKFINSSQNGNQHISSRRESSIPSRPNLKKLNSSSPAMIKELEYGRDERMVVNSLDDGIHNLQGTLGELQHNDDFQLRKSREKKNVKFPVVEKILANSVTVENQFQMLSDVVTPLCGVPYDIQLKIKYKKYMDILMSLRYTLKEKALTKMAGNDKGMACDLTQVRPAPVTEAYRNKDEYSIWEGSDGNPKTVGFFIGSPATQAVCIPPDQLINAKKSHKLVAGRFQEYIRTSAHGVCRKLDNSNDGIYRNVIVRSNREDQVMAIVKIHPKNLTEEEIALEKSQICQFFTEGPGQDCNLTSLYFQAGVKALCTADEAPFHLLAGEPYIYETMLGRKFRISPDAYFQINSTASEVLYTTVLELLQPTRKTILLDLCCGSGALSIAASRHVGRTVGIEVNRNAVEDAQFNARNNNINNTTFMCGQIAALLSAVKDELSSQDVVAVINPDQGGVNAATIRTLRACRAVTRVVYISCLPQRNAMNNFIELCKKTDKYQDHGHFTPTVASPVDLFPHTNHCELVMLLER